MEEFVKFLNVNEIKPKEIADFLGISVQSVGQIIHGTRNLPYKRLKQIKANDRGWDTSMLPEGRIVQTVTNNAPVHEQRNFCDESSIAEMKSKICFMEQLLIEKDRRIVELERTIQILMDK